MQLGPPHAPLCVKLKIASDSPATLVVARASPCALVASLLLSACTPTAPTEQADWLIPLAMFCLAALGLIYSATKEIRVMLQSMTAAAQLASAEQHRILVNAQQELKAAVDHLRAIQNVAEAMGRQFRTTGSGPVSDAQEREARGILLDVAREAGIRLELPD